MVWSSVAVQLMFGVKMWFSEIVEYKLQMAWQWERRSLHHLLGLRYSAKRSLQKAVAKLVQQPLVLVSEIFSFFFSSSIFLWEHLISQTLHSLFLQSLEKCGMFSCFTGGEWQQMHLETFQKKRKIVIISRFLESQAVLWNHLPFSLAVSLLMGWWTDWWQQQSRR